jgi:hypothetical protein
MQNSDGFLKLINLNLNAMNGRLNKTIFFVIKLGQLPGFTRRVFLRDIIVAVFRLRKGDVLVFIPPPTLYKKL